jgi:RNA polymerase sigma-70 factor (ECF subfamily)
MSTPSARTHEDEAAERALIAKARDGDREAFGALVTRHQGLVFKIAGSMLRNRADVEDVAQEAFLRAFAAMSGFRSDAPFGPWIARITTRACYDRLRQRGRRQEVTLDDVAPDQRHAVLALAAGRDAEGGLAARDLAQQALAQLSPKDRQVLVLTDALGYSPSDVAGMMGATALAVRVRLHRARKSMRGVVSSLLDATAGKE